MVQLIEVSSRHSAAAGCEAVYRVEHASAGLVGFIALHDLTDGPGFGGVRRRRYHTTGDAVCDAVALAEQMTLKIALAGLPAGGAKAVILDRHGLDLEGAYGAMGEAVDALGGDYYCGPDLGTGEAELAWVRRFTDRVSPGGRDLAEATASGVLQACAAALAFATGGDSTGFSAVVQGVGSVGRRVAEGLGALGGRVAIADPSPARLRATHACVAHSREVPTEDALREPVTLLAPCAVGPVVTRDNLDALGAGIICGSASQQLAEPALAISLKDRGVLYVPDFAVNAGAVIEGILRWRGAAPEVIRAAIDGIGPRVSRILEEARRRDWTPLEIAFEMVGR